MLSTVHDENVDSLLGRLEFESQLLAQRGEQRCACRIDGRRGRRFRGSRKYRGPFEIEIECAFQMGVILDGMMIVDGAVQEWAGELLHRRSPGSAARQPPETALRCAIVIPGSRRIQI